MMLANTLAKLAGTAFALSQEEILQLFLDKPEKEFSIHAITEKGRTLMNKEPGDWYGANSIT